MNKKKTFSMVEMLVTMAIFAVLSVMLLNSLLLNVRLSTKINIRARVRSDLNEIVTQIERDIRNAQEITQCGPPNPTATCNMVVNGQTVSWRLDTINHRVIRLTGGVQDYFSSPNLYFDNTALAFNKTTIQADEKGTLRYANIVVTLFAESSASVLGCESAGANKICSNTEADDVQWAENQVRQFSVSTRNYMID